MKKITVSWLKEIKVCPGIIKQFKRTFGESASVQATFRKLAEIDNWYWTNWLIVHCMTYKQRRAYSSYAYRYVLIGYDRPRDVWCATNAAWNTGVAAWSVGLSGGDLKLTRLKILRNGFKILKIKVKI